MNSFLPAARNLQRRWKLNCPAEWKLNYFPARIQRSAELWLRGFWFLRVGAALEPQADLQELFPVESEPPPELFLGQAAERNCLAAARFCAGQSRRPARQKCRSPEWLFQIFFSSGQSADCDF